LLVDNAGSSSSVESLDNSDLEWTRAPGESSLSSSEESASSVFADESLHDSGWDVHASGELLLSSSEDSAGFVTSLESSNDTSSNDLSSDASGEGLLSSSED